MLKIKFVSKSFKNELWAVKFKNFSYCCHLFHLYMFLWLSNLKFDIYRLFQSSLFRFQSILLIFVLIAIHFDNFFLVSIYFVHFSSNFNKFRSQQALSIYFVHFCSNFNQICPFCCKFNLLFIFLPFLNNFVHFC